MQTSFGHSILVYDMERTICDLLRSRKNVGLRKLLKEPAKFLSTIQIAITLSGFLGSAFAADSFSDPLVD